MPSASLVSLLTATSKEDCAIKNVWNHNLHKEFQVLRHVCTKTVICILQRYIWKSVNYTLKSFQ